MNKAAVVSAILLAGGAGNVMAICGQTGDNRFSEAEIRGALSGKRILATAPGGETWYEDHCSVAAGNGPANLYKVGAGSAVDPRALRGTWEIITTGTPATSTVRYTYTGTPNRVYTWSLYRRQGGAGQPVDFCDGLKQIAVITSTAAAGAPCP